VYGAKVAAGGIALELFIASIKSTLHAPLGAIFYTYLAAMAVRVLRLEKNTGPMYIFSTYLNNLHPCVRNEKKKGCGVTRNKWTNNSIKFSESIYVATFELQIYIK